MTYRTPVILLSDGYLANGSEPWLLPDVDDLPDLPGVRHASPTRDDGTTSSWPYLRDPETLARPWAIPGTPASSTASAASRRHDGTGNISYDPANHDLMVRTRQAKVDGIAESIPTARGRRPDGEARVLVLGLGLDVRPDRRGLPGSAGGRSERGSGAPAPPQPVPGEPRRGAAGATTGCSSRR